MGISGLLPLLKEITVSSHIKHFKGKTLAVDAYVWLHRGAYGCAEELATGKPTVKYVNYAMHRVRMLKYYGVTPYIVFDGGLLPSKMGTEGDRERRRNEALAKGNAFLAEGKSNQARECFVKAVDVTPAMAYQLIKALRQEGIRYVVAPYEADPQLAYLEKHGLVDGIITEDSDLLVFGCRNVLFKLDGEGNCSLVSRDDFSKCREYNFSDWSEVEFRQMAILSGCDYLESIQGLGLKTAYKLMRKYKTAEKVIQFVRLEGQLTVPRNYVEEFRRAELTFLHQRVFDPVKRELVHFSPLPEGRTAEEMPFVGAELDREYVCGLADGNIDPISKQAMIDLVPNSFATTTTHRTTYKPSPSTSSRPSSSKQAPAVQPAKGAASILNFFSRTPAAASPSNLAINPVKNVANQKRVHLLSGSSSGGGGGGKGKAPSPKRKSKFFGRKEEKEVKVSMPVKGKEKMLEVDEDSDEVMVIEEEKATDGDEDAELVLREIEMEIEVTSETQSIATEEPNAGGDTGSLDEMTPPVQMEEEPSPVSPRQQLSPTPCLSSPMATPPRSKLPSQPLPSDHDHPISDDALAISSPVSSAHADAGWEEPSISSPPRTAIKASPRSPPPPSRAQPPPPPNRAVKTEKKQEPEVIELSSDPIEVTSSDVQEPAQDQSTPRPPKNQQLTRKASSSQEDKKPNIMKSKSTKSKSSVQVRPDSGSKGKGKKRAVEEGEPEEEEEVDMAVQSVAASWRAKFMLQNSSTSRTPRPKTTSVAPQPPVPAVSDSIPRRTVSISRKSSSTSTSARIPLSPRSTNRTSKHQPLVAPPPQPTLVPRNPSPKRRRVSSSSTTSTSPEMEEPTPPSARGVDSLELHKGSSSPVVITNPKLLAFRFQGPSASARR
ncbi:uncharacterized protein JCM6883_000698 [Sporobolomyces salmoneus]|uniref:uncharacterized protein n=1 Tax=Sporobolomyces salmoneus TaxID=183962 RepID=UPI0031742387